jgi:hypothetical protein
MGHPEDTPSLMAAIGASMPNVVVILDSDFR